eukprot:1397361-Amphidinium_carterae.1
MQVEFVIVVPTLVERHHQTLLRNYVESSSNSGKLQPSRTAAHTKPNATVHGCSTESYDTASAKYHTRRFGKLRQRPYTQPVLNLERRSASTTGGRKQKKLYQRQQQQKHKPTALDVTLMR